MLNTVEGDIWFYYPNQGAAIFFAAAFGFIGGGLIYHAYCGGSRAFIISVMIGIGMEIGGFACRAAARNDMYSVALFAVPQSLIVLAPLFIAASNYLVISRIICAVSSQGRKEHVLCLPVRWITPIFVTCDVVTILIQVSGTTISAGDDWVGQTAQIGSSVLLAGLAIQTVTVAFFLIVTLRFGGRDVVSIYSGGSNRHLKGLKSTFISSVFIELRCIYRLIEHATGYDGYLFTHEWSFYLLEALPMIIATAIFVLWYPPHHVPTRTEGGFRDKEAGSRLTALEDGTGHWQV